MKIEESEQLHKMEQDTVKEILDKEPRNPKKAKKIKGIKDLRPTRDKRVSGAFRRS